MEDLNSIVKGLTKSIEADRQYWLVRTMGGDFYKQYVKGEYIAIGYNEVSKEDIETVIKTGEKAQELLKEKIKIIDKDEEINESYAAAHLLKFHKDMKIGDVVVIPARNSRNIQIGYIDSDVYEETEYVDLTGNCPFVKRRKVEWIKEVSRDKLNPKLQLMFGSRHIVSNIGDYSEYIDTFLNDFFIKDDKGFLVLRVRKETDIPANDFSIIPDLMTLLDEFTLENNIEVNSDDVNIKISVQSPGDILMYATKPEVLALIGLLILLVNGGEFNWDKIGLKVGTKGLITSISNFLDRRQDRKLKADLTKKLKNLEIEDPKDLLEFLKETKNPRDSY
jgi:hypothetical protein